MTQEGRSAAVVEIPRQVEDAQAQWGWVEPGAWTPRMLAALQNGVKGGMWFSLIDKVGAKKNLEAGFRKVKSNGGAAGVDHVTVTHFEEKLEENLSHLSTQVSTGSYRPQAIKRVYIDKTGSKERRPLGIPTVRDRVVQTALRSVMEPIFEKEFADSSYGFRPGRGCKDALRVVDAALKGGQSWVVDADIKRYFDSISHRRLMTEVSKRIADSRVLELVESFLKSQVMDGLQEWTPDQGTPQGAVISPLLANIYLNELDHEMTNAGFRMVRYADDLVVLCHTRIEAERALSLLVSWMSGAELTLHPEKTRMVDMTERGASFEFLGYRFARTKGKGRLARWPRDKSTHSFKQTIRLVTKRNNGYSLQGIVKQVNQIVRGWFEYFKHSCAVTFTPLDAWIRMRLRSILRRRSHRTGRGRGSDHQRWTNAYFAANGFFSMSEAVRRGSQSAMR